MIYMCPSTKKKETALEDKSRLYVPIYKIMNAIIKRLEAFDLDVPIYKIAWMEVRGNFTAKRHQRFRKDLMNFLTDSNEYRKIYWNLIKLARRQFDVEMKKDGSFAPDIREYESLKNEIPFVLIKGKRKIWIESYDSYLPKIRERSEKRKKKPRNGHNMYRTIYTDLRDAIRTLKSQRSLSIEHAKMLRKFLSMAKSNPLKPWEQLTKRSEYDKKGQNGRSSKSDSNNDNGKS